MGTLKIKALGRLAGQISVPGDKSISHRAVMMSAMARGKINIHNFLAAADCMSTVNCLRNLGVKIEGPRNNGLVVYGDGISSFKEPLGVLDAGNSGTTMRLMAGVAASLPFFSVITGDSSLCRRPMERIITPLTQMGASIRAGARNTRPPLAITGGGLKGIDYHSPVASAQVKSAVLLAGLQARGETLVTEPSLSRDHTERMLSFFNVPVSRSGLTVSVTGPCRLQPSHDTIQIPGDISSAAFFMVAALLLPGSDIEITGVGINPSRTGIIDVLKRMGADISIYKERRECGEPVADLRITGGRLKGVSIGGDMIPRLIDEIPVLAVASVFARGETVISGAHELKYKETDRLQAVVAELSKMGAEINALPGGIIINGTGNLRGARCDSRGDHRMAMALAVAGLGATGETVIEGASCIDISFPNFLNVLNSLTVE